MPLAPQSIASDDFAVDAATHTIRFERGLSSSPEEVFAAWTEADQVRLWWDPNGAPLARCEIDLRVGGRFEFVSQGHADRPFTGTYRRIDRPHGLLFDAFGAEGRVRLRPQGEGTHMLVEIACSGPEHLQQFIEMGVASGTSRTLDNLVAHLAS